MRFASTIVALALGAVAGGIVVRAPLMWPDSSCMTPPHSIPSPETYQAVKRHLASELGIDANSIDRQVEVAGTSPVLWADQALGLPRPGFSFDHILQPGHVITLKARGELYIYHTAITGHFRPAWNLRDRPVSPDFD